jgi:hypothetical protein
MDTSSEEAIKSPKVSFNSIPGLLLLLLLLPSIPVPMFRLCLDVSEVEVKCRLHNMIVVGVYGALILALWLASELLA